MSDANTQNTQNAGNARTRRGGTRPGQAAAGGMRAHHQTQHHRQWRRTRLCGDRRHDTHRHTEGTQGREHLLHRVRPRERRRQDRPGPTGHVHLQRRPGLIHHVPAHGFDRPEAHQRPRRRSGAGRPLRARGQRAHAAARLRPRVHRRGRRRILRDPRRGQAGTVVGGRAMSPASARSSGRT